MQLHTFFFLPLLPLGTSEESFCSTPKNKKKQVSFQSTNILFLYKSEYKKDKYASKVDNL